MKRGSQSTSEEDLPAETLERGLPRPTPDSARLTARLSGDEMDALLAVAKEHRWTATTALRVILREKLLGEKVPF
jgi:hypothetical protein